MFLKSKAVKCPYWRKQPINHSSVLDVSSQPITVRMLVNVIDPMLVFLIWYFFFIKNSSYGIRLLFPMIVMYGKIFGTLYHSWVAYMENRHFYMSICKVKLLILQGNIFYVSMQTKLYYSSLWKLYEF
jgi:hypothetical protein